MTKYLPTPGPWHVDGGCVVDARGNVVAMRFSRRRLGAADFTEDGDIQPVEADRNCFLLALAPELRDSLRELLTIVQAVEPKINDEGIDRAKDILARIRKDAK